MNILPNQFGAGKAATVRPPKPDLRKQLFNDRTVGVIQAVQLPEEMITQLWGIMFDLDPGNFHDAILSTPSLSPKEFYNSLVSPWLQRHPALTGAEVRMSGRGLHVVIWLDKPIEFTTAGQRQRWAGIVKAVQAAMPTDPDMPGITAVTRALGSINSKNGAKVLQLKAGTPVDPNSVLNLFEGMRKSPFRTVMTILLGRERVSPCPICRGNDTSLGALDREGRCYGSCGRVKLSQLYDVFLKPRTTTG